jgi:hypothetical protein
MAFFSRILHVPPYTTTHDKETALGSAEQTTAL